MERLGLQNFNVLEWPKIKTENLLQKNWKYVQKYTLSSLTELELFAENTS